jgi:catecholate siderophore receptor
LLPLGAVLLAGSINAPAAAQDADTHAPSDPDAPLQAGADNPGDDAKGHAAGTLGTVTVHGAAVNDGGTTSKTQVRASNTQVGKGDQRLLDIPQSVTVITEKLIQERNLDDVREVLRATAGVTFQAGETGEEDVRLRGFSLGQAGDIYRDGMRDAPLYERDTFDDDRIEVIKGSASMLFGKGSTGGVVNQVSKQPFLGTQHEAGVTVGNGGTLRAQADLNFQTGDNAAFRLNVMGEDSDNWGAKQRKWGVAPSYRWGINGRDEFSVGLYALHVDGRPNYAHPWVIGPDGAINPTLPAKNFYGLAGDHLDTSATFATLGHTHRFDDGGVLTTRLRAGHYTRDLLGSPIGFQQPRPTALSDITESTVLTRSSKGRVGQSNIAILQSDYSNSYGWGDLLAGAEIYDEHARRNNRNPLPSTAGLPTTTVGTPDDGAWVPDTRAPAAMNRFSSRSIGAYAQGTVPVTESVKLVGGLRFDRFTGDYRTADGSQSNSRTDNLWSPRLGVLYEPNRVSSYYVSYGTSFNTSGDAYQYGVNLNDATGRASQTPPEKSRNIEVGGKWDLLDKRVSAGVAVFYSQKYNERNTDPDTAAQQELLSGERHAAGMEFNLAGRLTPKWEIFWNHTWIPNARIDRSNVQPNAAGTGAQVQGDRPGLTPVNSGSVWTTYRVAPQWLLGVGANYRSSQSPEGQRAYHARSFVTFDAMAEYAITPTVSLKLNVMNLTNKLYADTLYRGFYQPGAPRRVQLTLKALF